jgi:hypothetical protein
VKISNAVLVTLLAVAFATLVLLAGYRPMPSWCTCKPVRVEGCSFSTGHETGLAGQWSVCAYKVNECFDWCR